MKTKKTTISIGRRRFGLPTIWRMAAKLIEKHGLAKGARHTADGSMCALGVLGQLITRDPWNWSIDGSPAVTELAPLLGAKNGYSPAARLADWNNEPKRTKAQVIRGFLRAADKYEAAQAK